MRFLLDESVDARLQDDLQRQGHDATSIRREHRPGMSDTDVLAVAYRENRVLLTNDHDFGELIFRRRLPHSGVVLFRLQSVTLATKQAAMQEVIENYADQLTAFLVVTEGGVRVRRAPRS